MRSSNIITAFLVFIAITAVILFRGAFTTVFTDSQSQKYINTARSEYSDAANAVKTAEQAVTAAQGALDTSNANLEKAKAKMAEAESNLAATIKDPKALERLRQEALEPPKFKVEVVKLMPQDVVSGLALSGKAAAGRRVTVTAETTGRVISDPLPSGTVILKGDILCKIDPGTTRAQLEQSEANYQTALTQFNVQTRLKSRGLTSDAAVLTARANYEQAQAAVQQIRQQVSNLHVKAPFNGKLATNTAELGTVLSPGATCAELVGLDTIKLEAFVSEKDIDSVKLGAPVYAKISNVPDQVEGRITSVGSSADPVTRAYPVEVMLDSNEQEILDGTSAKIYVSIAGVKGHLIPQNAITLNEDGVIGVMLYKDNNAVFTPVNVQRDTPEGTWVTGLEGPIDLIVEGQEFTKDGRPVEAVFAEKAEQ